MDLHISAVHSSVAPGLAEGTTGPTAIHRPLEMTNHLAIQGGVSVLLHVTLGRHRGHIRNLLSNSLASEVSHISIFHPTHRKLIPQTRPDRLPLNRILRRAVPAPGRLGGVGRCHRLHLGGLEQVGKDRPRLASLQVKQQLLVPILLIECHERIIQIRSMDEVPGARGHSQDAGATVISVVHEHLVLRSALQHRPRRSAVPLQNLQEVRSSHIGALVGDLAPFVDIRTVRLVEHLSREWVLTVVRNIVVGQQDDVGLGDPSALGDLVSVAGISLVPVVAVGVGPGHNDSPVRRAGAAGHHAKGGKLHAAPLSNNPFEENLT
mmetsp:Transcript_2913/g.6900  ORF Transcript_2913/g.6900 Transcript_2913/m.6900 type:complete len:321 (+) Transcript_2913:502-1464(+)